MHLSLHAPFRIPEPLRPRIWWILVALVAAQWIAWVVWFVIAAHHSVQDVPLVAGPGF